VTDIAWNDEQPVELLFDPNAPALPSESTAVISVEHMGGEHLLVDADQGPTTDILPEISPSAKAFNEPLAAEPSPSDRHADAKVVVDNASTSQALIPQTATDLPTGPSSAYRRPRGVFLTIGSGPEVRFIKADQLHLRAEPNRFSKSIGLIFGGDEVHVKIQGDWAQLDEGRWIRSRWLVKKRQERFKGGPPEGARRPTDDEQNTAAL